MVVQADGGMTYLPLAAIKPGMTLRVAAGERFCVDGVVANGASDVDRALVTGESAPTAIRPGMPVEAGTLNLTGSVDISATRPADQSFLAEITQMMAAAEHGRSAYLRLSDRMARAYAPVVHILALLTLSGWLLLTHGNIHAALTAAVSVLIITCPCALGLAVPVAHVIAAGRLFANGVLMKDGSALERLAAVDLAAFDKTGTLTTGTPAISKLDFPAGEARSIAKALAQRSIHPAAKALAAALNDCAPAIVSDLHEVPGHGVEAIVGGRRARLGRSTWVEEIARTTDHGPSESAVAFAVEGGAIFHAKLSERLRPGAAGTVAALAGSGISSVILSGDGPQPVKAVAAACGIAELHAGLRPGDKLQLMQDWAKAGKRVLMVGDGINDAPALAAAHASMAPASASDVGRMAADFVFTREDLGSVQFAFRAARETAKIVQQNFALAIVYNIFAVPMAMAGQLNPLIAAVAMSTSSIIVVANSLRLQLLKPEQVLPPQAAAKTELALA
jgi:Cu2+-exporting ATPase